jgi:hypothetical protein
MVSVALVLVALHGGMPVADASSCAAAIGKGQAHTLVDRCLEVSPATHPPCNALNPCDLIIDEIRRGCALLQATQQPRFCAQYSK